MHENFYFLPINSIRAGALLSACNQIRWDLYSTSFCGMGFWGFGVRWHEPLALQAGSTRSG